MTIIDTILIVAFSMIVGFAAHMGSYGIAAFAFCALLFNLFLLNMRK